MNWQEHYNSHFISAEEAAKLVKSGDEVVFTMGREAWGVGLAIAARKEELKDVQVVVPAPGYDFGWYDPGWEDSFKIIVGMITAVSQEIEANKNLIRTFGDNFIHVTEIDYFVEHIYTGKQPGMGSLAGRSLKEPEPFLKDIAANVNELLKDGDTIQIGVGRTTEPLVRLGMLESKSNIGYHSQATPPGIINLVREGVINGKCKTLNQGKVPELVHIFDWFAREIGVERAYDYGNQRMSWLGQLFTNWIGDDGFLWKLRGDERAFNLIGDITIFEGRVTRKYIEEGKCCVDIEAWAKNQRDEYSMPPHTSTIILPSREYGPVIYPNPPARLYEEVAKARPLDEMIKEGAI